MSDHLVHAYQSMPVSFTRGDGCYLWDSDGKQYLDALCGISVTSLGHNLPALTAAIQEQAATLLHTSNLYSITWQHKLAGFSSATRAPRRTRPQSNWRVSTAISRESTIHKSW
jgi:acetylornithine/succinyldiaminopimelate/putrescine aminotransferase